MTQDLWKVLHDATRRGYQVTFAPGTLGQLRVEILNGNGVRAFEPCGTGEVAYEELTTRLKEATA